MAAAPILSWEQMSLQQGSGWLFRELDLAIGPKDRLALIGRKKGRFSWLPLAGGWTQYRDLTAPQGATFQSQWRARSGAVR